MNAIDPAQLRKLEDLFAGPSGIVGERALALYDSEKDHRSTAIDKWTIWTRTMDSFFDFYLHSILEANLPNSPVLFACFVSNFWRLRSSNILLLAGYYGDSSALLRAVWETVRHLSAVRGAAVKFEDIWDLGPNFAAMPKTEQKKHSKKHRAQFEQKIEKYHADLLDHQEWESLKSIFEIIHKDVHRCELSMVSLVSSQQKGHGMRVFPNYDKDEASRVVNLTVFLMWAMTRHLGHFLRGHVSTGQWESRFLGLDEHFRWQVSGFKSVRPHLESSFTHYVQNILPI